MPGSALHFIGRRRRRRSSPRAETRFAERVSSSLGRSGRSYRQSITMRIDVTCRTLTGGPTDVKELGAVCRTTRRPEYGRDRTAPHERPIRVSSPGARVLPARRSHYSAPSSCNIPGHSLRRGAITRCRKTKGLKLL